MRRDLNQMQTRYLFTGGVQLVRGKRADEDEDEEQEQPDPDGEDEEEEEEDEDEEPMGDGARITGYGAVFFNEADPENTQYRLWDDLVERIMPGAFDRAIQDQADVRSLFNHDSNFVLGRTTAGTLSLRTDEVGLMYDALPPDTQLIRDQVLEPLRRKDVTGSSFMFVPTDTVWREQEDDTGRRVYITEVHDVDLWEVGPVTFPAYEGTTAKTRKRTAGIRRDVDAPAYRAEVQRRERQRQIAKAQAGIVALRHQGRLR